MKKFRITLNGKSYDVVAEIIGDAEAAASVPATAPAAPAGTGNLPSPLAGKVVSLQVSVGQSVQAGQQVMTLEAMKMNTVVNAPRGGTVQAILVNPGDSVEEGQPLLSIQ